MTHNINTSVGLFLTVQFVYFFFYSSIYCKVERQKRTCQEMGTKKRGNKACNVEPCRQARLGEQATSSQVSLVLVEWTEWDSRRLGHTMAHCKPSYPSLTLSSTAFRPTLPRPREQRARQPESTIRHLRGTAQVLKPISPKITSRVLFRTIRPYESVIEKALKKALLHQVKETAEGHLNKSLKDCFQKRDKDFFLFSFLFFCLNSLSHPTESAHSLTRTGIALTLEKKKTLNLKLLELHKGQKKSNSDKNIHL